jgi:hypothetical protein
MNRVLLALLASELRVAQTARHLASPRNSIRLPINAWPRRVAGLRAPDAYGGDPAPKDLHPLLNLLRWWYASPSTQENIVAKPNYHQARKQREVARKARQLEKQQRRTARASVADASSQVEPLENPASTPGSPVPGGE